MLGTYSQIKEKVLEGELSVYIEQFESARYRAIPYIEDHASAEEANLEEMSTYKQKGT